MKFCKIMKKKKKKNVDLCWKFGSKMQFLTTADLQRMKFGKIQTFSVALKIWLEIESLTTPDLLRMKFCKIKKIWFVSKISSKLTFLTTHNMQRIKFGTIQKFSVASIETFDFSGPAKDEIWQHPEIWSRVENLTQNWHFEKDLRRMKFCKILTFFSRVKHLDQNWHFDHSEHGKDEILQNLEIFSRSENLAQIES